MTLENEMKNVKGRIREAIYEGKSIFVINDWENVCVQLTDIKCFSTSNFYGLINPSCLSVYCLHYLPFSIRKQIVEELKTYTQKCGGNLI